MAASALHSDVEWRRLPLLVKQGGSMEAERTSAISKTIEPDGVFAARSSTILLVPEFTCNSRHPDNSDDEYDALSTLRAEAVNVSLLIAVTTSSLNAYRDAAQIELPRCLLHYIPATPVVMTAVADGLLDAALSTDTIELARLLLVLLQVAKIPRHQICSFDPRSSRCERSQYLRVREHWIAAASTAATFVTELCRNNDPDVRDPLFVTPRLCELISDVVLGGSPCFRLGRPKMPNWARERQHERRLVNVLGRIDCKLASSVIFVRDVSRGECGFNHTGHLKDGQKVTITLSGGRKLPARIVWSHKLRAGAQFDRELTPSDPLIGH